MAEQCHLVYKTNFLEEIKYFRLSIGKREKRSFSLGIGAIVLFEAKFLLLQALKTEIKLRGCQRGAYIFVRQRV